MLRIKRLAAADAAPVWSQVRPALVSLMGTLALSPEDKSLIAACEQDGDYLNFVTPLSGTLREVPCPDGAPLFFTHVQTVRPHFYPQVNIFQTVRAWNNAGDKRMRSGKTKGVPGCNGKSHFRAAFFLFL